MTGLMMTAAAVCVCVILLLALFVAIIDGTGPIGDE